MTIGIYKLNFKGTDMVYIGKSINLETRLASHISHVRNNTCGKKIAAAFKKYGIPTMEILLVCSEDTLSENENEAIEIFNSVDNGFNTMRLSDEVPSTDNTGDMNGMAKYSNKEIEMAFLFIVDNPEYTLRYTSNLLNISYYVLLPISSCTNHRWLEEKYPDKYSILRSRIGTRNRSRSAADRGIEYPPVVSPEGNIYNITNVREFCKIHDLDSGCFNRLLNKKANSHKGWKLRT